MDKLTTKKHKDGCYYFYWNGHDITGLWMDFFAGLNMKDESKSEQIFVKRYAKKLDKQFPPV